MFIIFLKFIISKTYFIVYASNEINVFLCQIYEWDKLKYDVLINIFKAVGYL